MTDPGETPSGRLEAWGEGADAADRGEATNPYREGTKRHWAWQLGYDSAARWAVSGHVPGVEPRVKMDTPTGLWGGTCICGWRQEGVATRSGAMLIALEHVAAKMKEQ